jgi:hypothetical protein
MSALGIDTNVGSRRSADLQSGSGEHAQTTHRTPPPVPSPAKPKLRRTAAASPFTTQFFMFTLCFDMSGSDPAPDPIDDADTPDGWERVLLDRQLAD